MGRRQETSRLITDCVMCKSRGQNVRATGEATSAGGQGELAEGSTLKLDLKHEVQVMGLLPKPRSSLQDELGAAVHHWFLIMRRLGAGRPKMLTEAEQQHLSLVPLPHTLLL